MLAPVGALLEFENPPARRRWGLVSHARAGGHRDSMGRAFTSSRDYLDATGRAGTLFGQLDFLQHGALDSLVIYLSPDGLPVRINPFAVLLLSAAAGLGGWFLWNWKRGAAPGCPVRQRHPDLPGAAGFLVWIVAPYTRVMSARGSTRWVAGSRFEAEGRTREATAMYIQALDHNTPYRDAVVARLQDLSPQMWGIGSGRRT